MPRFRIFNFNVDMKKRKKISKEILKNVTWSIGNTRIDKNRKEQQLIEKERDGALNNDLK